MSILSKLKAGFKDDLAIIKQELMLPGELSKPNTEQGRRATPENAMKYLYRIMWVDPDLRAAVLDIREMDRKDTRVKKIHSRSASAAIKGGLRLKMSKPNKRVERVWSDFMKRLHLHRREKLHSDARGLMMEGNLALQWILDADNRVINAVRMPSETLLPKVDVNGTFKDFRNAYEQHDLSTGRKIASFSLWQLSLVRLTPDNYDDMGSMGRPYLDATREIWKKLTMTEEDMVIRRRMRAPLQLAHSLEGASDEALIEYRENVERDRAEGKNTDFYSNKKLAVAPLQGDENLEQIADVSYLLDTFFSGSPAPKGLFGYSGELKRDILEDMKKDFFEEIDAIQDMQAYAYQQGFELELLLRGINPMDYDFSIIFAERRTETPNQATDRALKQQALAASRTTVWETAGLDPKEELGRITAEAKSNDPYPEPENIGGPGVSITPGNQRKSESATSISN